MKSIFDENTRVLLINRIEKINIECERQWGKMNVYQMLMHSNYWNEWILGIENQIYKQTLMGKIFGKLALKRMIKNEKPFDKNIPTSKPFKVKVINGDLDAEKSKLISLLNKYENYNNPNFIHDFFGVMTKEQIGILVYKHTDHHLRQFDL